MAANSSTMKIVRWMCRFLLGGVFIYAAITKLIEPENFVRDIDHYALVSYPLAVFLGFFLPWLELICGVAAILRWRARGALLLLLGLCGIFALALTSAWWRGLDINCGCFGHDVTGYSLQVALARDVGLGIIAIFLLRTESKT